MENFNRAENTGRALYLVKTWREPKEHWSIRVANGLRASFLDERLDYGPGINAAASVNGLYLLLTSTCAALLSLRFMRP